MGCCVCKFSYLPVYGRSVADRLKHEQPLDERLKNEFMLQQLVSLISSLDLADELARFVFSPLLPLY